MNLRKFSNILKPALPDGSRTLANVPEARHQLSGELEFLISSQALRAICRGASPHAKLNFVQGEYSRGEQSKCKARDTKQATDKDFGELSRFGHAPLRLPK